MSTIVGTPTLKGEIRKARASGYTFVKAIGDICDGGITMPGGTEVHITIIPSTDNSNQVSSIIIRDNIPKGMHKLQYTGTNHPFCWTHETEDHKKDDIVSEFGTGLKAASVNLGNQLEIITKYKEDKSDKYIHKRVQCNWDTMVAKNTFDPDIFDINSEYYDKEHISPNKESLKYGTSMTFCNLFDDFIPDLSTTISQLKSYISTTYYNSNRTITLNGDIIRPNIPFTLRQNHPWDIHTIILEIYSSPIKEDIYIMYIKNTNTKKKIIKKDDLGKVRAVAIKNSEYDSYTKYKKIDTLIFNGTRIQGCYELLDDGCINYKGGSINISRKNRMLANSNKIGDSEKDHYISFGPQRHVTEHKYNYLHLEYNSKIIGKFLGISYTKSVSGSFPDNMCCKALSIVQKELLKIIPNNTKHIENWYSIYHLEWDNKLSYKDNLSNARTNNSIIIQKNIRRYLLRSFASKKTNITETIISPINNKIVNKANNVVPQVKSKLICNSHCNPSNNYKPILSKENDSSKLIKNITEIKSNLSNNNKCEYPVVKYVVQNYLGIYNCLDDGYQLNKNNKIEAKIGWTEQRPLKRKNGGDYPKRKLDMISVDTVEYNCESILKKEIEKITGVEFTTKEQFCFPIDKLGIVKKTYNTVVEQHFRAPK